MFKLIVALLSLSPPRKRIPLSFALRAFFQEDLIIPSIWMNGQLREGGLRQEFRVFIFFVPILPIDQRFQFSLINQIISLEN